MGRMSTKLKYEAMKSEFIESKRMREKKNSNERDKTLMVKLHTKPQTFPLITTSQHTTSLGAMTVVQTCA